ncbi:MAG: hypothetical protein AAFW00_24095 [Bacteroidota bacterium]
MKLSIQIFFLLLLSFGFSVQLSAQTACSNINNKSGINTGANHVFGPKSFGQSVVANASCMGGNAFTSFSYWAQGNSRTGVVFKVFKGKTTTGTALVEKTVELNAPNFGSKQKITFDPIPFNDGEIYTFVCQLKWGNTIAHTSANAVPGEAYLQGNFYPGADLKFEVGIAQSQSTIEIISATWGADTRIKEVKSIIEGMVDKGTMSFVANNGTMKGDPAPGKRKTLTVKYIKDGQSYTKEALESLTFSF